VSHRKSLIGLSLFLVVAVVASWMVFVTLRREVGGPTNTYSALFTDASGLRPGDDVRVAGVRVGRVDGVELQGTVAKVTFRVPKDQVLYNDTIASVTYQNIIGQRYVGLAAGTSGDPTPLADQSQIPLERTRPSFDISYLLNGFEPLLALMDPQQVDNLTTAIIQALQGDSGSVLTLITETSALAESLAGPDQVLGEVITELNDVASNLAGQTEDLQTMIGQTRDVLVTLGDRRDQLVASGGSINAAVVRLATITENINPDLQELIRREPGFVAQITGPSRERLSYFGANMPMILKGLARASQDGAYVTGYLCDVNSSIFGFLSRVIPGTVRLASPGNVVQRTPMCNFPNSPAEVQYAE
jgi:phospholipid/cholesterol/gamma-HCH transport system substrate-binding protein